MMDKTLRFPSLDLLKDLQDHGYDVIGISPGGASNLKELEKAGIRHIPLEIPAKSGVKANLRTAFKLASILRQERVTIVHAHCLRAAVLTRLAAPMAGTPILTNTLDGKSLLRKRSTTARKVRNLFLRAAARMADMNFVHSLYDMHTMLDLQVCKASQLSFVGNGVDLTRFSPSQVSEVSIRNLQEKLRYPAGTQVIGYVGSLSSERKGFLDFLAAAATVRKQWPKVRFLIIGDSEKGAPDVVDPSEAGKYGIADRCIFVGQRSNAELPVWYSIMNVLVLPSQFGSMPRCIMEASAMGLPVVATDIPGNREAAFADRNALLVPKGNASALARAICLLLKDWALSDRLSQEGQAIAAEHFDERTVFSKIRTEYSRLISTKMGLQAAATLTPASV
jgi:glycosyltransferase involved in cell wall biosynthesis